MSAVKIMSKNDVSQPSLFHRKDSLRVFFGTKAPSLIRDSTETLFRNILLEESIIHPDFDPRRYEHDFALLRLDQELTFNGNN